MPGHRHTAREQVANTPIENHWGGFFVGDVPRLGLGTLTPVRLFCLKPNDSENVNTPLIELSVSLLTQVNQSTTEPTVSHFTHTRRSINQPLSQPSVTSLTHTVNQSTTESTVSHFTHSRRSVNQPLSQPSVTSLTHADQSINH